MPSDSQCLLAESVLDASEVVLTGDRPTGPLHLGHYAGSLCSRLRLQGTCLQTMLIADLQALTDHGDGSLDLRGNVLHVALDYLAVGLDPVRSTFALQSAIPELCEIATIYLNLVTVSRLERNPTVKDEIRSRGFDRDIPAGFLCYPVSQAADITAFRSTLVPVGDDQLPMIEQTNEIVRRVNRITGMDTLRVVRPLLSRTPRLPGIDGRKASKSFGNAISLNDPAQVISTKVKAMFTDPAHLRVSDSGRIEGNVVFAYLDAFDDDRDEVSNLKNRYRAGGLGDGVVKQRLDSILQRLIAPIRERRADFAARPEAVREIIAAGSETARRTVPPVLDAIQSALGLATIHRR